MLCKEAKEYCADSQISWFSLPPTAWQLIVEHLPRKARLELLRTCKEGRDAVLETCKVATLTLTRNKVSYTSIECCARLLERVCISAPSGLSLQLAWDGELKTTIWGRTECQTNDNRNLDSLLAWSIADSWQNVKKLSLKVQLGSSDRHDT
jgi:hypothetical protein